MPEYHFEIYEVVNNWNKMINIAFPKFNTTSEKLFYDKCFDSII